MNNPEYKRDISKISVTVDHNYHTIDVEYNDLDDWNNMITCVLGLGLLYNRCLNAGYDEAKVYEGMMASLGNAMKNFRTPPPGKKNGGSRGNGNGFNPIL